MAAHKSGFLFPKNFYYHLNMCFVNVSAELTCVFNVNGMTMGEKCLTYLADVFQCEYRVKFLWKTMYSNRKLQKMTNA